MYKCIRTFKADNGTLYEYNDVISFQLYQSLLLHERRHFYYSCIKTEID